jgi:Acyltransferase family
MTVRKGAGRAASEDRATRPWLASHVRSAGPRRTDPFMPRRLRTRQGVRAPQPLRTPTARTQTKRLDIQGVRALAVLLVALNHANVTFLGGGYVGVDVFFVVSGYLITDILLREGLGRNGSAPGRISIRGFYGRRVRRILPAASLTLVVTSIAVLGCVPSGERRTLPEATASAQRASRMRVGP